MRELHKTGLGAEVSEEMQGAGNGSEGIGVGIGRAAMLALAAAGRDAQKQFAHAAQLDLNAADKAELARASTCV
jgi:hypothetical protein